MANEMVNAASRVISSSGLRILLLGFLVLVLQIPVAMIGSLGAEREATRNGARAEIARDWGGTQSVIGPFLVVPYRTRTTDDKGRVRISEVIYHAVYLPTQLKISARASVQERSRGIFGVPVYTSRVTLQGELPPVDLAKLGIDNAVQIDRAELLVRLSDVHAVDALPKLRWNGVEREFEPASEIFGEASSLHVPMHGDGTAGGAFTIDLDLRGSGGLYFAPLGRETEVALAANWPHPSFQGGWLPKQRDVDASGFSAAWSIPYVARGFPAAWQQGEVSDKTLNAACFGVELITPVDPYRMSERSLKYAALFIGLTFLALWLFEVRTGVRVHVVQYLLVGAGMCLFYLLELSLAEQLGFIAAYAVASAAIVVQLAMYSRAVLKAWPRALLMGALIALLYGLLYVLLRDEDYSLLIGSSGLFVALSAVMFLTRRVQWGVPSAKPATV